MREARWVGACFAAFALSAIAAAQPANDTCTGAQPLAVGVAVFGSTVGATSASPASCGADSADVWYRFTPLPDTAYRITAANLLTSGDMSLSIFRACPDVGGTEIDCQDPPGDNVIADFVCDGPEDILIRLATAIAAPHADFEVLVETEATPSTCDAARQVASIPFSDTWRNVEEAFADREMVFCNPPSARFMHNAVWWRYDGDGTAIRVVFESVGFAAVYGELIATDCSSAEYQCSTVGIFDVGTIPGYTYYFVAANDASSPLADTGNHVSITVDSAPPVPSNDRCSDAVVLSMNTPTAGTTVAASGPERIPSCASDERDVWYNFDPAPDAAYLISITGATESGSLSVFAACGGVIDEVCTSGINPQLEFTSDNCGRPVLIRFATDEAVETDFTVTVQHSSPPANDDCMSATPVTIGIPVVGTTEGASGSDVASCGADEWDVWYTFVAAAGIGYRATARNISHRASIAAFAGCGVGEIACYDRISTSAGFVEFAGTGAAVLIRVASDSGDATDFDLLIEEAPTPPPNDDCANAQPLSVGVGVGGSTRGAAQDGTACSREWDVWYSFDPEPATTYQVRVEGGTDGLTLGLFSVCGTTHLQCDTILPFLIQFDSNAAGDSVLLRVATAEGTQQETDFTIRVDPRAPPPPNDDCADAVPLAHGIPVTGTTRGASRQSGVGVFAGERDVWYSFIPAPSTSYRATFTSLTSSIVIATFNTCTGSFTAGASGSTSVPPFVDFTSNDAGSPVLVRVATYEDRLEEADFTILVDFAPPPPANDGCAAAQFVALGEIVVGTTRGATQVSPNACNFEGRDVWYLFDPEPNHHYYVRVPDSSAGVSFSVLDNCDETPRHCARAGGFIGRSVDDAGSPFLVRVSSRHSEADFLLSVNHAPAPPHNDLCAAATVVDLSAGPFLDHRDTFYANTEGDTFVCGCTGSARSNVASIWYSVTTTSTLDLVATVDPRLYDSHVVVYSGACDDPIVVACDQTCCNGASDSVIWTAHVGSTYLVTAGVSVFNGLGGLTNVSIRPTCPAEYNGEAGVNVLDLLAYLNLWFAAEPAAETDGAAGITVFDLLAYLELWFPASAGAPCP